MKFSIEYILIFAEYITKIVQIIELVQSIYLQHKATNFSTMRFKIIIGCVAEYRFH
ncbi:hypothetical protein GGR06_003337 [Bacteroides reticulotermitis]|uniref:Uncharacterized protein n=1 Tax=Bacteroides reticulotermitis TaxID=1133319 RepID=A0A840DAC0_9BACE|nr:hypothetical protein [Bacteroides reticulotermitis]